MTPKEKALKLMNDFRHFTGSYKDEDGVTINQYLVTKRVAKRSALLHLKKMQEELLLGEGSDYWKAIEFYLEKLEPC